MNGRRFASWVGLFVFALYLLAFPRHIAPSPLLQSYAWVDALVRVKTDQPTLLSWTQQTTQYPDTGANNNTILVTVFSWLTSFWLIPGFWAAQQFPNFNLNAVQLAWLGQGIIASLFATLLTLGMIWCRRRQLKVRQRIIGGGIVCLAFMPLMQMLLMGENPIWFRSSQLGFPLRIHLLLPSLIIVLMLVIIVIGELTNKMAQGQLSNLAFRVAIPVTIIITIQMLIGAGYEIKSTKQAQANLSLWQTLADQAILDDALVIASPNLDTAQTQTNLTLAYSRLVLPTYIWLESDTILTTHWPELKGNYARIWLFEAGLQPTDPLGSIAASFTQNGFPQQEAWLDEAGRLTLFALPEQVDHLISLNIPFESGLTLVNFAITTASPAGGKALQVRLTWHLDPDVSFPPDQPAIVGFVHLLDDQQLGQTVAQADRILVDYINHHQSPLLPGQTVSQGYLLQPTGEMLAGPYSLIVGLYQRDTGQRLLRTDGRPDDFLYLTTLTFVSN